MTATCALAMACSLAIALTLRTRRIQAVHQTESLLHRCLGRVSLNVDLAGDSSGGRQRNRSNEDALARARLPDARGARVDRRGFADLRFRRAAGLATARAGRSWRIFRRSALLALLIVAVPGWWFLREDAIFGLAERHASRLDARSSVYEAHALGAGAGCGAVSFRLADAPAHHRAARPGAIAERVDSPRSIGVATWPAFRWTSREGGARVGGRSHSILAR